MASADRNASEFKSADPLPSTGRQAILPAQSTHLPLQPPPSARRRGAIAQLDSLLAHSQWPQQQHQQQAPLWSHPQRGQQWGQSTLQSPANGHLMVPVTRPMQQLQATHAVASTAAPGQTGITGDFRPRLHPQAARVSSCQIMLSPRNAKDTDMCSGFGSPAGAREVLAPDEGMFEAMLVIVGVMGFILMVVVVIRFLYAAEVLQPRRALAPSVSGLEYGKWKAQAATPVSAAKEWFAEEDASAKRTSEGDA